MVVKKQYNPNKKSLVEYVKELQRKRASKTAFVSNARRKQERKRKQAFVVQAKTRQSKEKYKLGLQAKTFLTSLVNHLMRDGKKNWAFKIVMNIGMALGKQIHQDPQAIYSRVFAMIRPYVEVRKVKVRRTTYMVPFPTSEARQKHLAALWLLETVRQDKSKQAFSEKFFKEIMLLLLGRGAVLEKKKAVYRQATKGSAFLHYRWY